MTMVAVLDIQLWREVVCKHGHPRGPEQDRCLDTACSCPKRRGHQLHHWKRIGAGGFMACTHCGCIMHKVKAT